MRSSAALALVLAFSASARADQPTKVEVYSLARKGEGFVASGARWEDHGPCIAGKNLAGWLGFLDARGKLVREVDLAPGTTVHSVVPDGDALLVCGRQGRRGWFARLDGTRVVFEGHAGFEVLGIAPVGSRLLAVGYDVDEPADLVLDIDASGRIVKERREARRASRALVSSGSGAFVSGWLWESEATMRPWFGELAATGERKREVVPPKELGGLERLARAPRGFVVAGLAGEEKKRVGVVHLVNAFGERVWRTVLEGTGDVRSVAVADDGTVFAGVSDAVYELDGGTGVVLAKRAVKGRVDALATVPGKRDVVAAIYPSTFELVPAR